MWRLAQELDRRRTGKWIWLRERTQLERIGDASLDASRRQITGRSRGDAPAANHAQRYAVMAGLLDQLGLAEPHLGRELPAGARAGHRHVRAELARPLDQIGSQLQQSGCGVSSRIGHVE